jgi:hypothetical protein
MINQDERGGPIDDEDVRDQRHPGAQSAPDQQVSGSHPGTDQGQKIAQEGTALDKLIKSRTNKP